MANDDRYRDDRDRYRRGDEGRWSEDRDRFGRGGERDQFGSSSGGSESYRRSDPPGRLYGRDERDIYGSDLGRSERERSGMWGRGDEGHGFERGAMRSHSREDYGSSGYGGGYGREQHDYRGARQDFGEINRERYQNRDFGSRNFGDRDELRSRGGFGQDYAGRDRFGEAGRSFGYGDDQRRRDQERRDDRGLWDRASDEVASWFGDRDAAQRREQDYRGRGPKGYRRSDDRIREDVNDRLSDDPYIDASDVDVTVSNGEVTLGGTVDSRHARRRAEDIAESISGVSHVQNNLRQRMAGGGSLGTQQRTGAGSSGSTGLGGSGHQLTGSSAATGGSGSATSGSTPGAGVGSSAGAAGNQQRSGSNV